MKQKLFLLLLFLWHQQLHAQYEANFYIVPNKTANEQLFQEKVDSTQLNFFQLIKKAVIEYRDYEWQKYKAYFEGLKPIYLLSLNGFDLKKEYYAESRPFYDSCNIGWYDKYFNYWFQSDIPIQTKDGDDSIAWLPDGSFFTLYPDRELLPLTLEDLVSIRIMSYQDNKKQSLESYIGFYSGSREYFWVNSSQLEAVLKNTPYKDWITDLLSDQTSKYLYMQYRPDEWFGN